MQVTDTCQAVFPPAAVTIPLVVRSLITHASAKRRTEEPAGTCLQRVALLLQVPLHQLVDGEPVPGGALRVAPQGVVQAVGPAASGGS